MRKYIGYGYTNNQGIATLDYDATGTAITPSGYLGTGGGEIDIQAELHDDSTIVSGTLSVWDTIKYDNGTDSTHNIWGTVPSDTTLTYGTEYATWSKTVSNNKYLSTSFTTTSDVCFEFDINQVLGGRTSRIMQISDSNDSALYYTSLSDIGMYAQTWNTIKIEFKSGKVYVNGVDTTKTYSGNPARFYFILYGSESTELRFKNFKCYNI